MTIFKVEKVIFEDKRVLKNVFLLNLLLEGFVTFLFKNMSRVNSLEKSHDTKLFNLEFCTYKQNSMLLFLTKICMVISSLAKIKNKNFRYQWAKKSFILYI